MSLVRKSEIYFRARRARRARKLKESGKRKTGVNKKTGKQYAKKKSGKSGKSGKRKTEVGQDSLQAKRSDTYRCHITQKGFHIQVIRTA